jgi:hypothetical protein
MYRDELASARQKLAATTQEVREREDRISAALIERLPEPLQMALTAIQENLVEDDSSLDAIDRQENLLRRYISALDKALEHAPLLDRLFNGLSRSFPEPGPPLGRPHSFSDHYSGTLAASRKKIHSYVKSLDRKANLIDKATNYELRNHPYLVEATFNKRGCPIRLQVMGSIGYRYGTFEEYDEEYYICLRTMVRRSMPDMRIRPDTSANHISRLFRRKKDIEIGVEQFDELFELQGNLDEIKQALNDDIRHRTLAMVKSSPTDCLVQVHSNVLSVEWSSKTIDKAPFLNGIELLRSIRRLPPVPLYKRARHR